MLTFPEIWIPRRQLVPTRPPFRLRPPRFIPLRSRPPLLNMAAGDVMLDASGNVILDASGNVLLDDGSTNDCSCCPGCDTGCLPSSVTVTFAGITSATCVIIGSNRLTWAGDGVNGTWTIPFKANRGGSCVCSYEASFPVSMSGLYSATPFPPCSLAASGSTLNIQICIRQGGRISVGAGTNFLGFAHSPIIFFAAVDTSRTLASGGSGILDCTETGIVIANETSPGSTSDIGTGGTATFDL